MFNKIKDLYTESIQTHISASSLLPTVLLQSVQLMTERLLQGKKIIVCGHGRSYINAQCLVANLLHRYELERPSFPSILLTLDSAVGSSLISENNVSSYYVRQFNAVAQQGDLLVVFSPLGTETPILELIDCAASKEMNIIAFTGSNNDHIKGFLSEDDIEIAIPAHKESRILESHLFAVNSICELIDYSIFSQA